MTAICRPRTRGGLAEGRKWRGERGGCPADYSNGDYRLCASWSDNYGFLGHCASNQAVKQCHGSIFKFAAWRPKPHEQLDLGASLAACSHCSSAFHLLTLEVSFGESSLVFSVNQDVYDRKNWTLSNPSSCRAVVPAAFTTDQILFTQHSIPTRAPRYWVSPLVVLGYRTLKHLSSL